MKETYWCFTCELELTLKTVHVKGQIRFQMWLQHCLRPTLSAFARKKMVMGEGCLSHCWLYTSTQFAQTGLDQGPLPVEHNFPVFSCWILFNPSFSTYFYNVHY